MKLRIILYGKILFTFLLENKYETATFNGSRHAKISAADLALEALRTCHPKTRNGPRKSQFQRHALLYASIFCNTHLRIRPLNPFPPENSPDSSSGPKLFTRESK